MLTARTDYRFLFPRFRKNDWWVLIIILGLRVSQFERNSLKIAIRLRFVLVMLDVVDGSKLLFFHVVNSGDRVLYEVLHELRLLISRCLNSKRGLSPHLFLLVLPISAEKDVPISPKALDLLVFLQESALHVLGRMLLVILRVFRVGILNNGVSLVLVPEFGPEPNHVV